MLKAKNNSLNLINLYEIGHRQTHGLHRLPDSRRRLCARSVRHPHDQCHGRSAQVRLRERDVGEGVPAIQGLQSGEGLSEDGLQDLALGRLLRGIRKKNFILNLKAFQKSYFTKLFV